MAKGVLAIIVLFNLLHGGGWRALGQSGDFCQICGERAPGRLYLLTAYGQGRQVIACEACTRISKRCFTCRLPVCGEFTTLSDGRVLCPHDAAEAVRDQETVEALFGEVKRELFVEFSGLGVLPDRNIRVKLVDQQELSRIFSGTPGAHPDGSLQGITRTRRYSKDSFEHEIFLCSGLAKMRLAAVAAHEYTHAWIHENVPSGRVINADVEEAFCELSAYTLMTRRGQDIEKKMILENAYTRGKIEVLVKAADSFQFFRVAQWMKSGSDETLDPDRTDRVIALKSSALPTFGFLQVVQARAPDVLTLKGLSGKEGRRFALINDTTLQVGEESRVRVAETNVILRCEGIGKESVIVRVNGAPKTTELALESPRLRSSR